MLDKNGKEVVDQKVGESQQQLATVITSVATLAESVKKQGEALSALVASQAKPPEEPEDLSLASLLAGELDIEEKPKEAKDLSPSDILGMVGVNVDKAINGQQKQIQKVLLERDNQLKEQFGAVMGALQAIVARICVDDARREIGAENFDNMKAEIQAVLKEYPTMSAKDAYVLAVARKGGQAPGAEGGLEMERGNEAGGQPNWELLSARGREDRLRQESRRSSSEQNLPPRAQLQGDVMKAAADVISRLKL